MQQLIEEWDAAHRHLLHGAPMESLDIVEILAPLRGRDVICVGKNYREHAEWVRSLFKLVKYVGWRSSREFHNSGFDNSDNKAQPDFPGEYCLKSIIQLFWLVWIAVIFTKGATSIIGTNQEIYPHPRVTQTLDYEGELGIIIGKAGIQISREDAWDYVWGATIINDVS